MKPELRKEARRQIHHACWLVTDKDSEPKQCRLVDVSNIGAKLAYDDPSKVPDKFILLLSADGKAARRCEVVRRSNNELALRFLGKTDWTPPETETIEV